MSHRSRAQPKPGTADTPPISGALLLPPSTATRAEERKYRGGAAGKFRHRRRRSPPSRARRRRRHRRFFRHPRVEGKTLISLREGRGRGCRPDSEASRAAAAHRARVSATGGVLRESAGERRGRAGPSPACSSSPATPFFLDRGGGLRVGCGGVGCWAAWAAGQVGWWAAERGRGNWTEAS